LGFDFLLSDKDTNCFCEKDIKTADHKPEGLKQRGSDVAR